MRISKAYTINGILLLLAIASWAFFLHQTQTSRARQKAEAEAFHASFLGTHLPQPVSEIRLLLNATGGDSISVFPTLEESKLVGPSEMKQVEAQTQFLAAICVARRTMESRAWKRLGEVRFISAVAPIIIWQVYETPGHQLGFQQEGNYYRTDGASTDLLDFIHDKRNAKAP